MITGADVRKYPVAEKRKKEIRGWCMSCYPDEKPSRWRTTVVEEVCDNHSNREGKDGESLRVVWVWKARKQTALSISVLKTW